MKNIYSLLFPVLLFILTGCATHPDFSARKYYDFPHSKHSTDVSANDRGNNSEQTTNAPAIPVTPLLKEENNQVESNTLFAQNNPPSEQEALIALPNSKNINAEEHSKKLLNVAPFKNILQAPHIINVISNSKASQRQKGARAASAGTGLIVWGAIAMGLGFAIFLELSAFWGALLFACGVLDLIAGIHKKHTATLERLKNNQSPREQAPPATPIQQRVVTPQPEAPPPTPKKKRG